MRRVLTILIVILIACSQGKAEEPVDLIAIADAADKALNAHDLDLWLSYFTDDGVLDLPIMPPPFDTKEKIKAMMEDQFAGSPDWHTTEARIFSVDNIVVAEHAGGGTNTGENSLGPATGNAWIWPHLDIYDFEGDKIKRLTTHSDYFGILVQLGLAPAGEMPELIPSSEVPDPEPTGLSPLEANAEFIRRWNSHDVADTARINGADYQIFAGPLGAHLDRVAMAAMNELYFTAFPDIQIEVVRAVDLGDGWVLTELISKGTHQGDFMGVPKSGYLCGQRVVWLTHYDADGLATEQSFYYDNLTLLNQMTTAPWPLDGIWVSTVPTPLGNLVMTTTYVAQDAAKTRYSGSLDEINAMPLLAEIYPDADPTPKWAGGQAVMVGRDKYEATFLGYSTKIVESDIGRTTEFVGLFTIKAYFELLDPNTLQGYGTGSYYMAAQDANQDGFPDEGQDPVVCIPWGWTGKRLTIMPGCIPTP
jgi:predicted ester cyclase